MVKKVAGSLLLILFAVTNVFAAEYQTFIGNGDIEYEIKLNKNDANKNVTFNVINPDKSWDKEGHDSADSGAIAFLDSKNADESGNVKFVFNVKKSGIYKVITYVDGESDNIYGEFECVLKEKANQIIALLNNAQSSAEVFDILKANRSECGISDKGFNAAFLNSEAANIIFNSIKTKKLETEKTEEFIGFCKKACIASLLSAGATDDISKFEPEIIIKNSSLSKWYLSDKSVEITKLLSGRKFGSIDDFDYALKEAVLLKRIEYPDGYGDVKNIISEFYKDIGLSFNNISTYTAQKISGNQYGDFAKLAQDIIKYENENSSVLPPSGGGSGGSGGGGGSKNISFNQNVFADNKNAAPENGNENGIYCRFSDMKDYQWASEAVEQLALSGVINGNGNGEFEPAGNVTREQFVKMIVSLFNINVVTNPMSFTDVKKEDWFYDYVRKAYGSGIINGQTETEFGSGKNILRQDAFVIAVNAINYCRKELKPVRNMEFNDKSEISSYALESVNTLANAGIIDGDENAEVKPQAFMTRAEAAKFIYNISGFANY